jgi:hypothetical protein
MPSLRARLRAAGCASTLVVVLSLAGAASAQPASGSGKVAAEALFEQGRSLMAASKYAEACPKFADSQRLDPSPGTLLNLASCYEKLGRTATSWATYREAASAANAAGRADYVASAQRHADALSPRLAKLTMTVTQPLDGLQVKRDGVDVASAEWGVPIPVDAGAHTIDATAPGHKPWSSTVNVAQDGAQVSVAVPALEAAPVETPPAVAVAPAPSPAPAPPPPAPAPDPSVGNGQRVAGIVVGVVGLAGLGLSGAFALLAKSKYNDSLGSCPSSPNVCSQSGVDTRNDALGFGNAATVTFVVGAAALAGGAIVYLVAPRAPSSATGTLGVSPLIGAGTGGALLQGTW